MYKLIKTFSKTVHFIMRHCCLIHSAYMPSQTHINSLVSYVYI